MNKAHILTSRIIKIKSRIKIEFPTLAMSSLGVLIYAMGVMWLTVPYHFPNAGVVGIALLLNYSTGFPPAILVFAANIGLMIWGGRELPKRFIMWTSYNAFLLSFLIGVLGKVQVPLIENMFMVAIISGLVKGVGVGLTFRSGTSCGGTDIIVAVLRKRFGIEMGKCSFYLNMVILLSSAKIVGLTRLLYGIIVGYVEGQTTDKILTSFDKRRLVFIVGSKASEEDVIEYLRVSLKSGSTVFDSKGGYSNTESSTLMCLLSPYQTTALKHYISKRHLRSFVIVAEASEVLGAGFKPWKNI